MAWVRKVNRHVQVLVPKTVGGNTAYVKILPGVITALGAGELITVRVGRYDTDNATPGKQYITYTNIDRRTDPNENLPVTVKYISY